MTYLHRPAKLCLHQWQQSARWLWQLSGDAHWQGVILTLSPLANTGSVRKSESILSTAAPCGKQRHHLSLFGW